MGVRRRRDLWLKVLVVSSKYPPEYSGSGLRAHRTYMRLREKFDIEFEVICSSTEVGESDTYEIDNVTVDRIVSKTCRNLNRSLASTPVHRFSNALMAHIEARAVKRKLKKTSFDLIHTFGYSPATAAAIAWSRANHVPLALEIVNPMATPFQYLAGTGKFSSQNLNHQSLVIAISKSIGEMCASHGLTENVWVRPNPVDVSNFSVPTQKQKSTARNRISAATEGEKLLVYVAKYITRKNHSFLIDVMTKLPGSFRLVLAGPPLTERDLVPGLRADEIQSLADKADKLGVGDRVEISHGFVDMAEYLAAADVFCFPAVNEAMGTPILESISSGVPVVANADESSFREWIIDGENGYLAKLDAKAWAGAIFKASDFEENKKNVMSSEIKSSISTDRIDDQYQKLLTDLATKSRSERLDVDKVLSS